MKHFNSHSVFKTLVLTILLSSATFFATAQEATVNKINELTTKYHDYDKFNGSVLVAKNGRVIYKKGFGMANIEWDMPNAANTKHRLGSITKQFSALLILQLAEAGKIDLQAPITTYLKDYPKATGDKITTHHLLTHTSGIPNYTAFPNFFKDESRNPYTPDEFVKKFQDKPLDFQPGERFSYSNSGYFLLGVLAEKISGKTYETLLQEKIFKPLGMNDTGYDHHDTILKYRATGYDRQGAVFRNSDYLDMSIPYAAGSMYSTVEDLYKWDQGLYTNTLLSKPYMEQFFKPYVEAWGGHYAYGWSVGKQPIGKTKDSVYIIGHGGGINGFNTLISRMPEDKSLVVLLSNTSQAPLSAITQGILGILHNKAYDFPKKSVANEVYATILNKGIKAGIDQFNNIKNLTDYDLNEDEINSFGYQFLNTDNAEAAAALFKLNVGAFPESSNVYDSYAEALMTLGKKDLAIANYKKSVELNPANQNGIDHLKKLGVNTEDISKDAIVSDAILNSYVGKYELMPNFIITITKTGSQLKAQATGQSAFDIFPKSETEFYLKVVSAQITFHKNNDGKVDSLTLFQGGRDIKGKRLD